MGVKIDNLVKNREAIAASVVKTLKEYPDRIKDLDPSALRSLTAIVGEAAMPVAAIARLKKVEEVAKAAKLPDLPSGYHYRTVGQQVQIARNPGRKADLPQVRLVDGKLSIVAKAVKGLETRADKAIFWSGIGRGSAEKAAEWSMQHGGVTLESVLASKGIKLPVWDASNPSSIAAWRKASTEFAAGARGDVRVLQGDVLRIDPIWSDEFKALQANPNVSSIRSINPETGAEVLLWSR